MRPNTIHQRTCFINVAEYLACYARQKFRVDERTGGIRIPSSFDLYHCVWQAMAKWPVGRTWLGLRRRVDAPKGNLLIHLPDRRHPKEGCRKNPRYWNYISPRSCYVIARELKQVFDQDLYRFVDSQPAGTTRTDAVRRFCQLWHLGIDSEDALLKNLQRRERRKRVILKLSENRGKES